MNGSPTLSAPRRGNRNVLGSLGVLAWTVTRFHRSPRGSVIVTALKNGCVSNAELPEPIDDEPLDDWLARLEAVLSRHAYDPADTEPPLLVCPLPNELVELVPPRKSMLMTALTCSSSPLPHCRAGRSESYIRNREKLPIPYSERPSENPRTESGETPDSVFAWKRCFSATRACSGGTRAPTAR
jgi:hypothetical protein